MNILKIKEALQDAQKAKFFAEVNASSDYDFWDGYETAIKFALFHLDEVHLDEGGNND